MYHVEPSWSQKFENNVRANVLMTNKSHGNLSLRQPKKMLHERQRSLVDAPWAYLEQIHGNSVIKIESAGESQGIKGDGLITSEFETPLSVQVADCAPIALFSGGGALGIVHAGWKGLASGVIDNACSEMNNLEESPSIAVVGPCIYPENYEFGINELEFLQRIFGMSVRSETRSGQPSLDLPEMVRIALKRNGINEITFLGGCTADSPQFWSHRANKDTERQVMVAWIESAA
tara:strand:- start:319 stop:1017 length:699 start_codon:yes stop_codon:yes gene_type:complete